MHDQTKTKRIDSKSSPTLLTSYQTDLFILCSNYRYIITKILKAIQAIQVFIILSSKCTKEGKKNKDWTAQYWIFRVTWRIMVSDCRPIFL